MKITLPYKVIKANTNITPIIKFQNKYEYKYRKHYKRRKSARTST